MSALLPFIIIGLVSGAVYGMAAVGLVVSYQTSGVFNFAYGALATVAAYLFYFLHVQHDIPWPLALLICTLGLSALLAWPLERFGERLGRQSLVLQVVSTVGILVLVEAVATQLYGANEQQFPPFLPTSTLSIFGTEVQWQQIAIIAIAVAMTGGLFLILHTTRIGKAMRAVVEDPDLLALCGSSPNIARTYAWFIGSVLATLSGVLLAPMLTLDASVLTLLAINAFGAVVIGRLTSLGRSWIGGLAIGVGAAVLTKFFTGQSILTGLPPALPFVVLFAAVLIFARSRSLGESGRPGARTNDGIVGSLPNVIALCALLAVLAVVPAFVGVRLSVWTDGLTEVILFISLGLLVRTAKQISLCQVGFAAIGAVVFSKLTVELHLPWGIALVLGGLAVVPVGALIAVPALRLSGLYLGLATLGFGITLQQMFYQSSWMFGTTEAGLTMPVPNVSPFNDASGVGYYYLVLGILVLIVGLSALLVKGRFGRLLSGQSELPFVMLTSGGSRNVGLVLIFCLSAFIAGISGALSGSAIGVVTGSNFDPTSALLDFAVVVISVGSLPWYALIPGLTIGVLSGYFTSNTLTDSLGVLFGASAIAVGMGLGAKSTGQRSQEHRDDSEPSRVSIVAIVNIDKGEVDA